MKKIALPRRSVPGSDRLVHLRRYRRIAAPARPHRLLLDQPQGLLRLVRSGALTYLYFQIPLMVLILVPALEGMKREWREATAG
jgi:hypothetical protein